MPFLKRRRRTHTSSVLLPWERPDAWFAGLASGRLWGTGLATFALVALVAGTWRFADERARVRMTRTSIAEAQRAVAVFRAEVGRCPRSVVELVHPPRAAAQYLNEVPLDGWGRPLHVRCPGLRPGDPAEVASGGADGTFSIDGSIM
jgi:hypothetical protein